MSKPSDEDYTTAIQWLRFNDGGDGERESCSRVAEWLEGVRTASMIRSLAKEAGVPVAAVRRRLKERGAA